jgi:hypothetical protein
MKITIALLTIASAIALVSADSDGKKCKVGGTKPTQKCPKAQVCIPDMGKWGSCHMKCSTGTEDACPEGFECLPLPSGNGTLPGGQGFCEENICPALVAKAKKGYELASVNIVEDYEEIMGPYYKSVFKSVVNNGYKHCIVNSEKMSEMCNAPGTFCFSGDQEPGDAGFCAKSMHYCTMGQKDACPVDMSCMGSTMAKKGDIGLCEPKGAKKCSVGAANECGKDMACEPFPGQAEDLVGAEGVCAMSPCEGTAWEWWEFEGWVTVTDVKMYHYGLPAENQKAIKKAIDE